MQYRINLVAGEPLRQKLQGSTFLVMDTGAAPDIDLKIEIEGFAAEELRNVRRGFKLRAPSFTSCLLTAPVDCAVEIVTSWADISISIDYQAGSTVNANILGTPTVLIGAQPVNVAVTGQPLAVDTEGRITKVDTEGRVVLIQEDTPLAVVNDRGSPGTPVYVVGATIADAPAVTLQENAAVAVNDTLDALVTADADRRGLRFLNVGPDPVAVGSTGLTWAKRVIVLDVNDTYIEDRAANLAWSAICDAGKTASVHVQEVIA